MLCPECGKPSVVVETRTDASHNSCSKVVSVVLSAAPVGAIARRRRCLDNHIFVTVEQVVPWSEPQKNGHTKTVPGHLQRRRLR